MWVFKYYLSASHSCLSIKMHDCHKMLVFSPNDWLGNKTWELCQKTVEDILLIGVKTIKKRSC